MSGMLSKPMHFLWKKGSLGKFIILVPESSYKIADILDKLLSFSNAKITVKVDQSLFRPIDDPDLVCDAN